MIQWAGTPAITFALQNIVQWAMGPALGIASLAGTALVAPGYSWGGAAQGWSGDGGDLVDFYGQSV